VEENVAGAEALIPRDSKMELVNIDQEKQGKMNPNRKTARILEDVKISVKIKLSALWVGLMLLYLYNDVFTFFRKKFIEEVLAGEVQISQVFMLGATILMAIPIFMVFLSLVLPARVNRWTNIIVGIFLAVVLLTTLLVPGVLMAYYALYMILEAVFIALIVWHAWKWPKQEA